MFKNIVNAIISCLLSEDPFIISKEDQAILSPEIEGDIANDIKGRYGNVLNLADGTTFMVIAKPVKLHTSLHSANLGLSGWMHAGEITEKDLQLVGLDPQALSSNKDGIEIDDVIYCRWDGKYVKWVKKADILANMQDMYTMLRLDNEKCHRHREPTFYSAPDIDVT